MPAVGLTAKQERFVAAYLGACRFNATAAAIEAGYGEKTAYSAGSRLLKHVEVSARVRERLTALAMPAEGVLAELSAVAMAPWREFLQITTDPRTGDVVDVRMDLSTKVRALEILAKAHGLFAERVDVGGTLTTRVELVGVSADDV